MNFLITLKKKFSMFVYNLCPPRGDINNYLIQLCTILISLPRSDCVSNVHHNSQSFYTSITK